MTLHEMVVAEMAKHGFTPRQSFGESPSYSGYLAGFSDGKHKQPLPVLISRLELDHNSGDKLAHLVSHRVKCAVEGYREAMLADSKK